MMTLAEIAAALGYEPKVLAFSIEQCPRKSLSGFLANLQRDAQAAREEKI